jgi:hypothetical protein
MSESTEGEILKASGPDTSRIEVGMDVVSVDGESVGKVKEIGASEFLLDRPLARDLWVPFSSVMAIEDYTSNFRGPVQPTSVVLAVTHAHVDKQGWRQT